MKKQIIYYLAIVLSVMLTGCEMLATIVHGERPENIPVTSIIIGSQNYYLTVGGEGIALTAVVLPTNATKDEVKWSYSDTIDSEYVRIGPTGLVTGNKTGRAYVKATASNSKIAECVIHVMPNEVPLVSLIKDTPNPRLPLNGTEILTVTLNPPDATNQILKWESLNENVVTVLPNGVVTAKAAGTATIKVTATSGETTTFDVTVDAAAAAVTGVSISPSSVPSLSAGSTTTLTATVTPSNAIKNFSWSSSNPSIASVSTTGVVTGISAGNADIIVTTGGKVAVCPVTVTGNVPLQTPVANDFDVSGLTQIHTGSPCTVNITPKSGKSPGAITVYYNGSTAAPSAVGTYTVTFDVAAATGWNRATGLVAGQLSIAEDIIEVSFTGLTANGSSSQTTTQLTLTFSPPLGLASSDITLSQLSGVTAGALSGSGGTYTLQINGVTAEGDLRVTINKQGYAISPNYRTVRINYVAPATSVTFQHLAADGNSSQTTTVLTLDFSQTISGLAASDITLSGVSGVTKGTFSGSNPYYLHISGFNSGGTLSVTIGNKAGYAISGSPQTVQIYYYVADTSVTPSNLGSYLASLSSNNVHDPHSITVKVSNNSEFYTVGSALLGYPNTYVNLDFTGSTATSIMDESFHECKNLVGIIIPNGFTSIGNNAFGVCLSLSSITLPNSVTSIGEGAFNNCLSLSSITIPSGVTSIFGFTFYNCANLASVTIPSGVSSIWDAAFSYCDSLTSVTFQGSVYIHDDMQSLPTFPGDLVSKYSAYGIGTYTRFSGSETWTKQ